METLHLDVVSPYGSVFSEDVQNVTLPGSEGEFGVYPNHSSVLSTLKPGIIKITKTDDSVEAVIVNWGYVKVSEHKVSILIDEAIAIEGDNESSIVEAVAKSKELLKKALPNDVMMITLESQVEVFAKDLY